MPWWRHGIETLSILPWKLENEKMKPGYTYSNIIDWVTLDNGVGSVTAFAELHLHKVLILIWTYHLGSHFGTLTHNPPPPPPPPPPPQKKKKKTSVHGFRTMYKSCSETTGPLCTVVYKWSAVGENFLARSCLWLVRGDVKYVYTVIHYILMLVSTSYGRSLEGNVGQYMCMVVH